MSGDNMSYKSAMKAAGADVHYFKSFGDYQGTWWAKVTYNGETGWVRGSYGSCSGCDAFEAEFPCWEDPPTKEQLAQFGSTYLEDIMSKEQALKVAKKNAHWDVEAEDVVKYIENN